MLRYILKCEENLETLLKDRKVELNKWKGIPCSWIERLNVTSVLGVEMRVDTFSFTALHQVL